jgi:D-threo-aldose 1-dehydrogenase
LAALMDPAARRSLGRTQVSVSQLGIGGGSSFVRAGGDGPAVIDAAWNAGLRYFDTAPLYGAGESERTYGAALAHRPRDAFAVSTKVGREAVDEFDYSAQSVARSIARSCERLGTSRIDIALIHDVDPQMHGESFETRYEEAIAGAYTELAALRDRGVVGAVGIGVKDSRTALRMLKDAAFDCVMLAGGFTLLVHDALDELLPFCSARGVSVLLAAPFNTGILATGAIDGARYFYAPAPAAILERTRRIEGTCARHGVSLPAAALQFPLLHPAVASVVVGHERPQDVARNVAYMRHDIPAALWAELREEGLLPI